MQNKIGAREYLHNSQHVPMGCGPMSTCTLCKEQLGETVSITDTSGAVQSVLTESTVINYIILGSIGAVVSSLIGEFVMKRIIRKIKGKH
jgi:hypothetical protein